MRAEPTHADPAAGPHASDAPLFAEVAGLAFTALIDGVVPAGPGRRHRGWFGLGHADPRTTRRYDRSRHNLDRHPTYKMASQLRRSHQDRA